MVFNILSYIKNCPQLSEFVTNIDFLGKNPCSLSLSGRAENKVVKAYTDGDSLINSTYTLKLRLPYGVDMNNNLANSRLIKNVEEWFTKNSERGILPELDEDKIPISAGIKFLNDKAVYLADTAVFTADVTILYYKTKSL